MTIKQLKPFPPIAPAVPVTPRCEADVSVTTEHERQWRARRYGESTAPFQCVRPSSVEISGRHYCRLHGGHKALDMLIAGELVEKAGRS